MPTVDEAIQVYLKMRAKIDEINRAAKEQVEPLKKQMDTIETFLAREINRVGMDSLKGNHGTVFKTKKDYISIGQKEAFKTFIAESMLMNLQPHMYKTTQGEWQPDGEEDLKEHTEKLLNAGAFDLLTLSANKTNCKDFMTSNEGVMPPGINYTQEDVVQIRKATKK